MNTSSNRWHWLTFLDDFLVAGNSQTKGILGDVGKLSVRAT
jgi:hypothetical protein